MWENEDYLTLLRNNTVIDYSFHNAAYLKETFNIDVKYIYFFDFPKKGEKGERDIDIFFCGARTRNREQVMEWIRSNTSLNVYADLDYKLTNQDELTSYLLRSKYVINIPFYRRCVLPTHRVNKALSCGCQVITPPSHDPKLDELYKPYVHFGDIGTLISTLDEEGKIGRVDKKGWDELMVDWGEEMIESDVREIKLFAQSQCENFGTESS